LDITAKGFKKAAFLDGGVDHSKEICLILLQFVNEIVKDYGSGLTELNMMRVGLPVNQELYNIKTLTSAIRTVLMLSNNNDTQKTDKMMLSLR